MSKWLAILLTIGWSLPAVAQNVIEAQDGAIVKVALEQPNLVEAKNGRITAFVFTEGKFTETIDPESGVLYLRPLEAGAHSGFIEVQAADGISQRFNLVLVPDDAINAQRIVLSYPDKAALALPVQSVPQASEHVATIKKLLKDMFGGKTDLLLPAEAEIFVIGKSLEMTKLAKFDRGTMTAETFSLRNYGSSGVDINEALLHIRDDIVAVVAEASTLAPGAKKTIYLVRARGSAPKK